MKGHIRERSPGHWAIVLEQRDPSTGERKRKWHSFEGTKRGAQIECARLISAMTGGTYLEPNKTTLAEFLERWLDHIKSQVSPKTHERYSGLAKQNIIPAIGAVHLSKLKPAQISAAYTKALIKLAPRTVGHMHRVLKQALGQAVKWEVLNRNPADAVDPPQVEWQPMQTYDFAQTADLLDQVRDNILFVPVLLTVFCGLRRGEICALKWRNIDLTNGQMSVAGSVEQTKGGKSKGLRFKSPKSGKGRTVALPETVIEELKAYRVRRAQEFLRLGVGLSDDDLVVSHEDSSVMAPIYISQNWPRFLERTTLPRIRFHDLRHTHATHLLASGVHPKIASERLGHSKVGVTLDLYSHVIPGMQEDAAATVDAALKAASQARQKINGSNPVAEMPTRTERE
jgi:integrase